MGTLYRRMGDPVKAIDTYEAAREVFRKAKHSDGEIHVLHNIGIVRSLDDRDEARALQTFTDALNLAIATSNPRQAMLGHLYRGEALLRLGRAPQALDEYRVALADAERIHAAEEQWTAHFGIAQSYRAMGQSDRALAEYQQAVDLIESLRGGLGASTLKTQFLGNKRSVYDAYIETLLASPAPDRDRVFRLCEMARSRNLQDALRRNGVRRHRGDSAAPRSGVDPGGVLDGVDQHGGDLDHSRSERAGAERAGHRKYSGSDASFRRRRKRRPLARPRTCS